MKKGFGFALGCGFGVIVFFIIIAVISSAASSSSSSSSSSGSTATVESGAVSGTNEETVEETPQVITAKPGDKVNDEHFEIYYLSCSEYTASNQFSQPAEGKKYVKFDFTFKNISDTDTTIGGFECYCNNAKCESSYVDSTNVPRLSYDSVSGGRETSGSVIYEVPQDAALSSVELEYSGFFDNKTADKIIFVGE
ncbi:MAG: DUF4352 domain-containing protein [Firmicutes bacterium]|nr:DUF4352 domain-containing protein [Bacillota bacterium]